MDTQCGRLGVVLTLVCALGACFGCTTGVAQAAPDLKVDIVKESDVALKVMIGGEHFTTYHYSNDEYKPYLWPVLSEGGVGVTRDFPMGKEEKTKDHPHHRSMWSAFGDVNGTDCWSQEEKAGYQHSDEVTFGKEATYAWIKAKNTWQTKERKPVLAEAREYRFYATPAAARFFDVQVTFTANNGDVLFKDTKEGGIFSLRIRDCIAGDQKKGTMTLDGGRVGEDQCWGKASPWCDYSGPIEGAGVRGVAVFDNPANLRHPTRWHVRNYGLMGANCFGLSFFTEKEPEKLNGDYTLKAGESLTFKYRVYVHTGDPAQAKVADYCAAYTAQPDAPPVVK